MLFGVCKMPRYYSNKLERAKQLCKQGVITRRTWWKQPQSPLYEANESAKEIASKYFKKKESGGRLKPEQYIESKSANNTETLEDMISEVFLDV